MGTIKPFNVDEMRIKASERIHKMFRGAPFIYVKYKDNFAEDYCQYKDGTTAFFTVWYRELLTAPQPVQTDGQHYRAMQCIHSMV